MLSGDAAVQRYSSKRTSRFDRWLNNRIPPASSVTLKQKQIFIVPTWQGAKFSLLVVAMVLAGINYQNSLVLALAFLLGSLFMVGILHTYRNLAGLNLAAGPVKPAFAGEEAEFVIVLRRLGERQFESLELGWDKSCTVRADLLYSEEVRLNCPILAKQRGRLDPGRLLVESRFPLGLFRAWSWVDLNMETLVYPRPIVGNAFPTSDSISESEGELALNGGAEDFYGLREYQPGDPVRHIAWKVFGRTGNLMTKQFAAYRDKRVWLDWEYFHGLGTEERLSRLCYWVLQLNSDNDEYGLRIPGVEISPGRGENHRNEILRALALYGE